MELIIGVAALAAGIVIGWLWQRLRGSSALSEQQAEAASALADERAGRQRAEVELGVLREQTSQFENTAKVISNEVLAETTKQLRGEFDEQRKRDRDSATKDDLLRTERLEALVKPVTEKLDAFQKQVEATDKQRSKLDGEFSEKLSHLGINVETLGLRTTNLVDALKRPNVRGAWGELQLRSVIERAGMSGYCDFTEQTTVTDGDGRRLRPDVLVKLPGEKLIVVDAKVPLDAFLAAQEAETQEAIDVALDRHARQVREHIKTLATKRYQDQFDNSPDLVVMFLPNEGIYHGALDADRTLFDFAVDQHVLIATPTTLVALLRAVNYGWTQEKLAANARDIAIAGTELHKRIVDFAERFQQVGKNLNTLVGNYNRSVATLDGRVVPQLRKLEDLEARSAKQLDEDALSEIDETARAVLIGEGAASPQDGMAA